MNIRDFLQNLTLDLTAGKPKKQPKTHSKQKQKQFALTTKIAKSNE